MYVCLDKCRTFEGGSCADVNKAITAQMRKWESADNCQSGGEKCLYMVMPGFTFKCNLMISISTCYILQ